MMVRLGRVLGGVFVAALGAGLGVALTAGVLDGWGGLHHFSDRVMACVGIIAADGLCAFVVALGLAMMATGD